MAWIHFPSKLVFFCLLLSLDSARAAPLRFRQARDQVTPAPAVTTTPLTALKAQQDSFTFDLASMLSKPASTVSSPLSVSTIPHSCASLSSEQCNGAEFEVVNVTYDDCGDPWTVCRCTNANMTMETAVERLGQIPVGLRRYVSTVVVAPGETRAATLTSGEIRMFGDTQVDSWVHESAHAFDWATGSPLSGTPEWTQAIGADTCAPDVYATTGANEEFAQMTVMKVYALLHDGSLPPGWERDCMAHQMAYIDALPLFTNWDELFGGSCAVTGGSVGSRHSTPPPTKPTRVQAKFSPETQTQTQTETETQPTPTSTSPSNLKVGTVNLGAVPDLSKAKVLNNQALAVGPWPLPWMVFSIGYIALWGL